MADTPLTPQPPHTVLFHSDRAVTLHWVALVAWLPVPLTAWLLSLPMPSGQGWASTPLGPGLWWLIPALLAMLAVVLPAATFLLHDRYVLRLVSTPDGSYRLTTWLLWGRRTRVLTTKALADAQFVSVAGDYGEATGSADAPYVRVRLPSGRRLILDAQGDAPFGWDAVEAAFGPAKALAPQKPPPQVARVAKARKERR